MKRPRQHNESHLDFIRSLPCCVCGNDIETEAAHLRVGNLDFGKPNTGMQEKPSDKWALPLCGNHHREQHNGAEITFWRKYGIDPFVLAMSLYVCSGDHEMAQVIIARQTHALQQWIKKQIEPESKK